MAEPSGQSAYVLKRIKFFNRDVTVVLQNVNGPCPLLAIANVLSLRNRLKLPSEGRDISQERLVTMVADLLLDASKQYDGAAAAHAAHAVSESFEVLSKLTTGIDVNVKFHSVHGFEATREVAVFDLLGISLVHGWIIDPQDGATAAVFGKRSYNELVELIAVALGGAGGSFSGPAAAARSSGSAGPAALQQQQQQQQQQVKASQEGGSTSSFSQQQNSPGEGAAATVAEAPRLPPAGPAATKGGVAAEADNDAIEGVISDLVGAVCHDLQLGQQEGTEQQQEQEEAPPAARAPSISIAVRDAAVVRDFLNVHCSQLTPAGVAALATELREHQLAVFFRNNHFSTLFKHEGRVYLLVTDQGYASEPDIVWERLDAVDGNTTLCTATFEEFVPHAEPPFDPEAFEAASAAAAAAAAGGKGHEDADFALALQLQLAEEEAAAERARVARERQQQQAAAAQGTGQQMPPHQQAAVRQQHYQQQQQQQQQQGQRRWSGGGHSNSASSGATGLEERIRVGRAKVEEKCSIM